MVNQLAVIHKTINHLSRSILAARPGGLHNTFRFSAFTSVIYKTSLIHMVYISLHVPSDVVLLYSCT